MHWTKWTVGGLLGLGCLVLALEAEGPGRKSPKKGKWLADYAAAKAEAQRSGRPLFVVFR